MLLQINLTKMPISKITKGEEIEAGRMALDIGPKTLKYLQDEIKKAKTVTGMVPLAYLKWINSALALKRQQLL